MLLRLPTGSFDFTLHSFHSYAELDVFSCSPHAVCRDEVVVSLLLTLALITPGEHEQAGYYNEGGTTAHYPYQPTTDPWSSQGCCTRGNNSRCLRQRGRSVRMCIKRCSTHRRSRWSERRRRHVWHSPISLHNGLDQLFGAGFSRLPYVDVVGKVAFKVDLDHIGRDCFEGYRDVERVQIEAPLSLQHATTGVHCNDLPTLL